LPSLGMVFLELKSGLESDIPRITRVDHIDLFSPHHIALVEDIRAADPKEPMLVQTVIDKSVDLVPVLSLMKGGSVPG
jgi:hypothetical protein